MNKQFIWEKNIEQFDYFYNNRNELNIISREDLKGIMEIASYILSASKNITYKNKALNILYDIGFLDNITLDECWNIYWILKMNLFRNSYLQLDDGGLDVLYNHIYKSIRDLNIFEYEYINVNQRNKDIIIIITNQFLSKYHSPTRRVLDYAYHIQKYLNKNVIIINDSSTNYKKIDYLCNNYILNYFEEYCNTNCIEYRDETFNFYQVKGEMINIEIVYALVSKIYSLNPLMVYSIGDSSIVADLTSLFTTTVALACSYDLPNSNSKYLLLGRKINENDLSKIQKRENVKKIIETTINYNIASENIEYTRDEFGIGNEKFIVSIVGNRIDTEIDEKIIEVINKLVSNNLEIEVVFIGEVISARNILEKVNEKYRNKIHFLGSIENASRAIKIFDVYLNLRRNGGGRSAFESIHYGVPVVTLKYGDVYYCVGDEFSVDNYDEMYKIIIEYFNDKLFYGNMSRLAVKKSKEISDITNTQKMMIKEIMEKEL